MLCNDAISEEGGRHCTAAGRECVGVECMSGFYIVQQSIAAGGSADAPALFFSFFRIAAVCSRSLYDAQELLWIFLHSDSDIPPTPHKNIIITSIIPVEKSTASFLVVQRVNWYLLDDDCEWESSQNQRGSFQFKTLQ